MSLDIQYRPRNYPDVLGQEATITILREYVRTGRGFQQSYLFCGGYGSGKTTLGRILARALLCEDPQQGGPCDKCPSCRGMLRDGTSMDFVEVDAATNSGKADITKITEEIAFTTFSGKRRVYLFDEAHQLSRDALDALLKPLEDNVPGSADKKLVCIFCTTEPERMRATILSRCAPAFIIQPQKPEVIAQRLAYICKQEGMEADPGMLLLIAEMTECHIRDALKAIEGVSMLGAINREHVVSYLHLDQNGTYLDLLECLGTDINKALAAAKALMQRASPVTCYERLMEVAMLAYQAHLGDTVPAQWNKDRLAALGSGKGDALLGYAARFAHRPGRPTAAMLLMDIAHLHHVGGAVRDPGAVLQVQIAGASPSASVSLPTPVAETPPVEEPNPLASVASIPGAEFVSERDSLWLVNPKLTRRRELEQAAAAQQPDGEAPKSHIMSSREFADMLGKRIMELGASDGRSTG